MNYLAHEDGQVGAWLEREYRRQQENIELIASENITSPAVMAAVGSCLTNKYAEGYPGRRYYGGCEYVDEIERLAVDRARQLFGAEHANVQPHSGAQANLAAYAALLQPGDTLVGMDLSGGGHLTHGASVNQSGKLYRAVGYGVDPQTGRIDYDQVEDIVKKNRPKLLVAGASAYPRALDFKAFADIAHRHGALLLVDMAHIAGLVAGGQHESPVPYADVVTTTTHKTLRGPRGCGVILCRQELAQAIDRAVYPGLQGSPKMDMIAARAALAREAMTPAFRAYQQAALDNAQTLAQGLREEGFRLVTGGTDTHLLLVDVRSHIATGEEADRVLSSVGLVVNREPIPFDPQPEATSGIRIGTPALTTRGLEGPQFRQIARWISQALRGAGDPHRLAEIRGQVTALAQQYPLFAERWIPREKSVNTP